VLVARSPHATWDSAEGRVQRLQALFSKKISAVVPMLEGIKADDILPTDLITVFLKQWTSGRKVLIGDAAHGFEPFAGLGGSMALEDAYVLAGELIKEAESSKDVTKAFESYERLRRDRVKRVRKFTHRMGAWLAVTSPLLRKLINIAIPHIPERIFSDKYFELLREEL